jgi:hypothetical protein
MTMLRPRYDIHKTNHTNPSYLLGRRLGTQLLHLPLPLGAGRLLGLLLIGLDFGVHLAALALVLDAVALHHLCLPLDFPRDWGEGEMCEMCEVDRSSAAWLSINQSIDIYLKASPPMDGWEDDVRCCEANAHRFGFDRTETCSSSGDASTPVLRHMRMWTESSIHRNRSN